MLSFLERPPLGIGEDNNIVADEVEVDGEIIKIYSPTDCVKDRLASYIHFKAPECLDQAVLVAQIHPVKLDEIKAWCVGEKGESQWEDFISRLKEKE